MKSKYANKKRKKKEKKKEKKNNKQRKSASPNNWYIAENIGKNMSQYYDDK